MSDAVWYYVDRQQQRNGPVTAAAVAEAYGSGRVDDNSLVWREGLGAWTPLAGHRAELGIAGPAAGPPPLQPAYPPAPRKSSNKMGCLIVAIVLAVVSVPMLAILAAIALPAYQDYIARSQVHAGLADIRGGVTAFEESIQRDLGSPASTAEIGLPDSSARCSSIYVQGTFDADSNDQTISCVVAGNPKVQGAEVRLTRGQDGSWTCTVSGIETRYRPAGCQPG